MKALTIQQPWADLITSGPKRIENRTTLQTRYRGILLIHAGLTYDQDAWRQEIVRQHIHGNHGEKCVMGAIVGAAQLVDIVSYKDPKVAGDPWMNWGCWCWMLDQVQRFPEPIPCKGKQGLWVPDAELLDRVNEQIGRVA